MNTHLNTPKTKTTHQHKYHKFEFQFTVSSLIILNFSKKMNTHLNTNETKTTHQQKKNWVNLSFNLQFHQVHLSAFARGRHDSDYFLILSSFFLLFFLFFLLLSIELTVQLDFRLWVLHIYVKNWEENVKRNLNRAVSDMIDEKEGLVLLFCLWLILTFESLYY